MVAAAAPKGLSWTTEELGAGLDRSARGDVRFRFVLDMARAG